MTSIRQRRFLLLGALAALLTVALLVVRVGCLDGTVYWRWIWGADAVAGICEGRLLPVYVVLKQWLLLLGAVMLAAIIWQRSRTPS